MTSNELRQKYLDFFKSKEHAIIPSASLIPENDPTVLFTTAGMHPLVPYLMGENHPGGKRVANVQKCIRTSDIDEVGDAIHHTFFEMLGNWSFGDYFKKEAIEWSWEFLISPAWLNLDKKRLAVSVFKGDEDAPFDKEAFAIWKDIGISEKRIAKLPKKNNWWGPAGETGPCGPDTEIFYWTGQADTPAEFDPEDANWVEIWNNVFMQFNKNENESYELLSQKNVDTGMGLERILAALNGFSDSYKTDLYVNLIFKLEQLSGKEYGASPDQGDGATTKAMRIIADHIKAATFIIGDDKGVTPSNTDQGYIVRRLIRRAVRYGRQIGVKDEEGQGWTKEIAKIVAHDFSGQYPELKKNIDFVIKQLKEEEIKFNKTLERGERELENFLLTEEDLTGDIAFNLYQTYGFPLEMTEEIAKEKNKELKKRENFFVSMKKHQELSRTASAGMFKGGLADASEETKRLHTAAHLLLASLRKVLGDQVFQKGSNITAERLRFDFSYSEKMSKEQIEEVEKIVNKAIKDNLPVTCEELEIGEAKKKGAIGVFESKYSALVKVYTIGAAEKDTFSKEICGGPHVNKTGELGCFKIQKEESSSAGVRRIKAILS
jgi:alanyl-tRNA synthetase